MMTDYGYFLENEKEYIITRPDTPRPWINYLNNGQYCALISNTAGGLSFYIDPRDIRILRHRYNTIPTDRPGRYFYIRNKSNSEYWSPTWQPVMKDLDKYECKHGLGYSAISSTKNDIEINLKYFVPMNDDVEIWAISIRNTSSISKELNIFTYAEFCLWNAVQDQNDLQFIQNVARANFEEELQAIIHRPLKLKEGGVFFSVNAKLDNYDCDRESFIGNYRSEENPINVEKGECTNSEARGGNPIAATNISLKLAPNESKELVYVLGISREDKTIKTLIQKYQNQSVVEAELEKIKTNWDDYLSKFKITSPDTNFNQIINVWNPYQCKMTFDWARYVSYYETGIGRGIGFRDCCQDTLSVCHTLPERVKKRLSEMINQQFEDGKVYHTYFPLTGEGLFPEYANPLMKFFGDDHLWMIFAMNNYLKETGDYAFLDEEIEFVEKSKAKVYEHLKRVVNFTKNNMGPHGFPLIGTADWNDCLQLHGPNMQAESVMVAMQYHLALLEIAEIAEIYNNTEDAKKYIEEANKYRDHINNNAWDGKWYLRGFDDEGRPVGTNTTEEGKIFLNTQSWAVISKVATTERAITCMNSVNELLYTKYGIKLLTPPYTKPTEGIGGLTDFPPGLKENGAIFCHTNPWAEIAECINGNGDRAFKYYNTIAPSTKNKIADIHKTEPYVYAQMITGIDHPKFGAAKNSWLTGTASWTLRAATNWIVGIRPEHNGLKIDPCIPKEWSELKATRIYRNSTYEIVVHNPNHISKGIKEFKVDNVVIDGNIVPIFTDGKSHQVEIVMG